MDEEAKYCYREGNDISNCEDPFNLSIHSDIETNCKTQQVLKWQIKMFVSISVL